MICMYIFYEKANFKTPMMADERFERGRDNFGKFIYQLKTETLVMELETIQKKLYRQNVSLLL